MKKNKHKLGPLKLTIFFFVFIAVFFTFATEFRFPLDFFNGKIKMKWTELVAILMVLPCAFVFMYGLQDGLTNINDIEVLRTKLIEVARQKVKQYSKYLPNG